MSRLLRSALTVAALVTSIVTVVPGVVEAGVGAEATPNIPDQLTVGDTDVPVSIVIGSNNDGTESGNTNTVCNWQDNSPPCTLSSAGSLPGDPGINAVMACGVLGPDTVCDASGADPGVFAASPTGLGAAGSACAGVVFDIVTSDAAFGTLRFTPQAPPNVQIGPANTCRIEFTVDVVKMPTVDSAPGSPGVQTVFIADNTQWTDTPNGTLVNSARGTDSATIAKNAPTITTTASAGMQLGAAGTLVDVANVFGQSFPDGTATVSFRLYGPADTACAGTPVFEDLDNPYPTTGGPITSDGYTPTAAGTHRWVATYSGDSNNAQVVGTCGDPAETVAITPAAPSITTVASSAIDLGDGTLTDTATVEGRVGPVAGATVDFRLYGPNDPTCAAAPVFESLGIAYPVAGGPVSSAPYTPTAPGTYLWVASYSGDANNEPAVGTCGDVAETTTVDRANPVLTTEASTAIALGGTLTDAAAVTGRVLPADSTIDFRLFGPNDDTCAGTPVFESLGVAYPAAGGTVTSTAFTPTAPGVYRWVATYNGDVSNEPVVGTCGDPTEMVRVFTAIPTIVTNASDDVFLAPDVALTDLATVIGRIDPVAGATIDFRLYGPNDATCSGTPIFESLAVPYPLTGGAVSSEPFTPTLAGTYRWVASYSGDANNAQVAGLCGDPAETTQVSASPLETELPATGPNDVRGVMLTGLASILLGLAMLGVTTRRRRHPLASW